jgi:hypothetical protein
MRLMLERYEQRAQSHKQLPRLIDDFRRLAVDFRQLVGDELTFDRLVDDGVFYLLVGGCLTVRPLNGDFRSWRRSWSVPFGP